MKVGVENGSRGVGDASGVAVGDGLAVAVGDGDGGAGGRGGSCASTRSGSRNRSEITVNAHEDRVITSFLLVVIEMELVDLCEIRVNPRLNTRQPKCSCRNPIVRRHASAAASAL